MSRQNILSELSKDERRKWDKWFSWHKDWKRRYDQDIKEIKSYKYYRWGEKRDKLKHLQKMYMDEMWKARSEILGH